MPFSEHFFQNNLQSVQCVHWTVLVKAITNISVGSFLFCINALLINKLQYVIMAAEKLIPKTHLDVIVYRLINNQFYLRNHADLIKVFMNNRINKAKTNLFDNPILFLSLERILYSIRHKCHFSLLLICLHINISFANNFKISSLLVRMLCVGKVGFRSKKLQSCLKKLYFFPKVKAKFPFY